MAKHHRHHSHQDRAPQRLCKNAVASPEHAMNAGGKRSNAMANSHVPIALYIVMVGLELFSFAQSKRGVEWLVNSVADCTYDQPSNRRRNPAPQYIEALESRLQRAETLLRTVMPNVDLNDPNIDNIIQQQRQAGNAKPFAQGMSGAKPSETTEDQEAHLRSMIHSTGQLDLDEHGRWDFHVRSLLQFFIRLFRSILTRISSLELLILFSHIYTQHANFPLGWLFRNSMDRANARTIRWPPWK